MKKIKIFFVVVIIIFGYWFVSSAKELYFLINKYPSEFAQKGDFSFYRLYNTYQTLSFSEVMIQRGYTSSSYCNFTDFKNNGEKERLLPLVRAEHLKSLKLNSDSNAANHVNSFSAIPVNCTTESKLINFEFKCKEAYATYACESGDYVKEFTYTANGGGKCYFINYKKSWGIEPKRTISDTKRFFIGGFSDSIFDSPECQPTNR